MVALLLRDGTTIKRRRMKKNICVIAFVAVKFYVIVVVNREREREMFETDAI